MDSIYRLSKRFDTKCTQCSLTTGNGIGGHSFCRPKEVELIIVSAYPGNEEIKQGFSLAPNAKAPAMDVMNAGRLLRNALMRVFDQDPKFPSELKPFYKFCAYTNMIKCSPIKFRENKEVTKTHINTCKNWLEEEIREVAEYNPTIPILLAGGEAAKLLGKDMSVYVNRRKVFMYKNFHPTTITFNPIEVVKYSHRTITKSKTRLDESIRVEDLGYWKGIVGSVPWHFIKDLELIKSLVIKNYEERKHR